LENFYDGMYLSTDIYPIFDDLEEMLELDDDLLSLLFYLTLNLDDTLSGDEEDA